MNSLEFQVMKTFSKTVHFISNIFRAVSVLLLHFIQTAEETRRVVAVITLWKDK